MEENKLTPTEVMSLAKGFYNIHKAVQYLDSVKNSPRIAGKAKYFINGMINRLQWCLSEMNTKLGDHGRNEFRKEITNGDTIQFDNVFDEMIRMTPEQRDILEHVVIAIRKGEVEFRDA